MENNATVESIIALIDSNPWEAGKFVTEPNGTERKVYSHERADGTCESDWFTEEPETF